MDDLWYVDIVNGDTDLTEKRLGPYDSESLAERAERGVNRNLDHDRFYTMTVGPDEAE